MHRYMHQSFRTTALGEAREKTVGTGMEAAATVQGTPQMAKGMGGRQPLRQTDKAQ